MSFFISHLVYAKKALSDFLPEKEEKGFFVGTTFPDIRYLGVIDREETHFNDVTFEQIQDENNSFHAGVKFHSLIDKIREGYMEDHVYELIPKIKDKVRSLKIAEDLVLYEMIDDWTKVNRAFKDVLPEEKKFLIDDSKLSLWHRIVTDYLKQKPSRKDVIDAVVALNFSEKEAREIIEDGYKIIEIEEVRKLIFCFYKNLENELTK